VEVAEEEAPELVVVEVAGGTFDFLLGEPAVDLAVAGTAVVAIDLVGFCWATREAGGGVDGLAGVSIGWLLDRIEIPGQPLAAASATSFAMDVGVAVPANNVISRCLII